MKNEIDECITLTYLIDDSLHDLKRYLDLTGTPILDTLFKDFAQLRTFLSVINKEITNGQDDGKRPSKGRSKVR